MAILNVPPYLGESPAVRPGTALKMMKTTANHAKTLNLNNAFIFSLLFTDSHVFIRNI
jgi:hypothetical protein